MVFLEIIWDCIKLVVGLTLGLMFLPAIIGIVFGVADFKDGNIFGGITAFVIGFAVQALLFFLIFGLPDISSGYHDEECPYCGSGDTDGNHCYTCDDDF